MYGYRCPDEVGSIAPRARTDPEVVVEEVLAELDGIAAPAPSEDWRGAMRMTVLTARRVMLRHRWAPRVLET